MQAYLDILKYVLKNGEWKENRTGVRCLTCANLVFKHDMSNGFPAITTRRAAFRSTAVELEGFIGGITSKTWYHKRGCKFWDNWANPQAVNQCIDLMRERDHVSSEYQYANADNLRKKIQLMEDDLGPIYGFSWRNFAGVYNECDTGPINGTDQLKNIVDTLKTNPNDRRMFCSAWNPNQLDVCALPACHVSWGLTHINGTLHLSWTQRSNDLVCGNPHNIISYALLLLLLCKEANLKPGTLTGLWMDAHIYENHMDGVQEQLSRNTRQLPTIQFSDYENIFSWTHEDVKLINYNPHPSIKFEVAV